MSIEQYSQPLPELHTAQLAGEIDLRQWAMEADDVHRVAMALCKTSFVPSALRGKPDEVAAMILYGRDVKLPPMIALAQINIIEGRASMSALAMRGLAQANGVKFRVDESTETRCRMAARAPGDADWTSVTWTIDRAQRLGVATKTNWTKQPTAMLIARATSELCRLVAAPLFLGLSYSSEELADGGDLTGIDIPEPPPQPAAPATRTYRREPIKAAASVPAEKRNVSNEGYSAANVPNRPLGAVVERPNAIEPNVRAALQASFKDAGIHDRVMRLAYVSDLLKREVHSINQITNNEGKKILHQLLVDYPHVGESAEWADVDVAEVPAS